MEQNKQKTAERELANIRRMLNNSQRKFAAAIGMEETTLNAIELGNRKLTKQELIIISSLFIQTINVLTMEGTNNQIADANKRKEADIKRNIIIKKLSAFISTYNPLNPEVDKKLKGNVSYVEADEPITPGDRRFKTRIKKL